MSFFHNVSRHPAKLVPSPPNDVNLLKMDFNTMTESGPTTFTGSPNGQSLTNPWGYGISIVPDSTGSGRGNMARIDYSVQPPSNYDDNRALTPNLSLALGQGLWFQGDVYLDPSARMDPSGPGVVQRKLLYWGWTGYEPHPFDMVLTSFGPQFELSNVPHQQQDIDAGTGGNYYIDTAVSQLTTGAWRTIKVHIQMESAYGAANGILKVWVDGVVIYDRTNMQWTNKAIDGTPQDWTVDYPPASFAWSSLGFGDQVSTGQAATEYRYWDNVSYATTEAAL